ncbi:lasso peptide biosynthesis B2 protein [Anaerosporobacter sp.]
MKRLGLFMKYNKNKMLFFRVLILSAFYRMCILIIPERYLRLFMGKLNCASEDEESEDVYRKAIQISHAVNRVCSKTPWKSQCLVRALTAQRLLIKYKIHSTLYLGVGKEEGKMVAHAWLRCGKYYLTGGTGKEYVQVAMFMA